VLRQRLDTGPATDRLRVNISKSKKFTFGVTVRPGLPVPSLWRQTALWLYHDVGC
jgi:hypothetical protein